MSPLLLVLATGAAIVVVDQIARRRSRPRAPMSRSDWARLARRCALSVRDAPAPRHLGGHIDDIPVTVQIVEEDRCLRYAVHAALPVVLPADAHVSAQHGGRSRRGAVPLRSPILRGLLRVHSGGARLGALLDDPALVGPLLAVFQQHPEATLDALGVHIPGETARPRAALPAVIADAVALASAVAAARRRQESQSAQ